MNPFLDQHKEVPEYIVTDAEYGSEENYMYINDALHNPHLITYGSYHKESKKKYKENSFNVENWRYLKAECKKKLLEEKNGSIIYFLENSFTKLLDDTDRK